MFLLGRVNLFLCLQRLVFYVLGSLVWRFIIFLAVGEFENLSGLCGEAVENAFTV